jgi:hypothetical protein
VESAEGLASGHRGERSSLQVIDEGRMNRFGRIYAVQRHGHRVWGIAALISVVIIVAVTVVGTLLNTTFNAVTTALGKAVG